MDDQNMNTRRLSVESWVLSSCRHSDVRIYCLIVLPWCVYVYEIVCGPRFCERSGEELVCFAACTSLTWIHFAIALYWLSRFCCFYFRRKIIFEEFQKYDKDRNGYVSLEEATEVLNTKLGFPPDKTKKMLEKCDRNGDNRLSYDEFVEFYFRVEQKWVVCFSSSPKTDSLCFSNLPVERQHVLLPFLRETPPVKASQQHYKQNLSVIRWLKVNFYHMLDLTWRQHTLLIPQSHLRQNKPECGRNETA